MQKPNGKPLPSFSIDIDAGGAHRRPGKIERNAASATRKELEALLKEIGRPRRAASR